MFLKKKRPVVIEQTRFLGTVLLCSEFKSEHTVFPLEYVFAGKVCAVIFI